jgi:hypothetical protein
VITYEINKSKPTTTWEKAKESVLALVGPHTPTRHQSTNSMEFMGKLEYAHWIEEIKKEYPINSRWTLAAMAFVPGREPCPLFTVKDIHEIHWSAPIGEVHKQPRCVLVVSEKFTTKPIAYEPKMLRRLQPEELELVNLRNQKAEAHVTDNASNNETFAG